jgi:uncharacterized protein with HEPN domain
MSKRDQGLFLEDILEAVERIEEYTDSMDYEDFLEDRKTVDAVLKNLEIIGEAVKNLSDEIKEDHPEVHWKGMAGMRDKLIHGYFGVNPQIVWETVQTRIPALKIQIRKIQEERRTL